MFSVARCSRRGACAITLLLACAANAQIPDLPAAAFRGDEVQVDLPEAFQSFCRGGADRYFVFHLPKRRQLFVIDAVKAESVGAIITI